MVEAKKFFLFVAKKNELLKRKFSIFSASSVGWLAIAVSHYNFKLILLMFMVEGIAL
jgi:hypothetical protein